MSKARKFVIHVHDNTPIDFSDIDMESIKTSFEKELRKDYDLTIDSIEVFDAPMSYLKAQS